MVVSVLISKAFLVCFKLELFNKNKYNIAKVGRVRKFA